jgi:hypothetical protein
MNLTEQIQNRKILPSKNVFKDIKSYYSCKITPNKTMYNTNIQGVNRFTPDGKNLLCLGTKVVLYKYLGPIGREGDDFTKFFEKKYEVTVTAGNEFLCKDFSLFTKDQDRMILASVRSVESASDDVTFWVLDIQTGHILGSKTFLKDYIFLNNCTGVHLYRNYLAIASVKNQSIYICHIRVLLFYSSHRVMVL